LIGIIVVIVGGFPKDILFFDYMISTLTVMIGWPLFLSVKLF